MFLFHVGVGHPVQGVKLEDVFREVGCTNGKGIWDVVHLGPPISVSSVTLFSVGRDGFGCCIWWLIRWWQKFDMSEREKKTNEGVGYTSRGVYIILDRSCVVILV